MDSVSQAEGITETNFGIRAQLFEALCAAARDKITKKVKEILAEDQPLSPQAFVEKRITVEGQAKLANLNERTHLLFKNIIADVCVEFAKEQALVKGLMMLSLATGNWQTHGQFIKEAALPFVEELITELDEEDPDLLNEAVSKGIAPHQQQVLDLFKIQFEEPIPSE